MGPSNDRPERSRTQARHGRSRRKPRPRRRRCLLKGCDFRFKASRPQQRYCSAGCTAAARAWSRWKARRAYRRRPQGRESRRRLHKTYRLRRAGRGAAAEASGIGGLRPVVGEAAVSAGPSGPAEIPPTRAICGELAPPLVPPSRDARTIDDVAEGSSRGSSVSVGEGISCDRPGCYDLFCPTARSPKQRFCTKSCRCAMERVCQRERRWRERHGLGPP